VLVSPHPLLTAVLHPALSTCKLQRDSTNHILWLLLAAVSNFDLLPRTLLSNTTQSIAEVSTHPQAISQRFSQTPNPHRVISKVGRLANTRIHSPRVITQERSFYPEESTLPHPRSLILAIFFVASCGSSGLPLSTALRLPSSFAHFHSSFSTSYSLPHPYPLPLDHPSSATRGTLLFPFRNRLESANPQLVAGT